MCDPYKILVVGSLPFRFGIPLQRYAISPYPMKQRWISQGFLPYGGCHASTRHVTVADVGREDSNSRGWECGADERSSSKPERPPWKHGIDGTMMSNILACKKSVTWLQVGSWTSSSPGKWTRSWQGLQSSLDVRGAALSLRHGGPGSLESHDGLTRGTGHLRQRRMHEQRQGSRPNRHCEPGSPLPQRTHHNICQTVALDVERPVGGHAPDASNVYAVSANPVLDRPFVVGLSCLGKLHVWIFRHWTSSKTKALWSGSWWLVGLLCYQLGTIETWPKGGTRRYRGSLHRGFLLGQGRGPLRCAEDDDRPVASSSRGPPVLPTASTALEIVAAKRVDAWRKAHRMEQEEDFAWAFSTQEAAILAGGHCLAEAWLEARARQEANVLPVASEMMASIQRPRPTKAPELTVRAKPKAWGKVKRKSVRLRENPQDKPEAVQRRVFALSQVFLTFGALRPLGFLTSRLQKEWEQTCERLSQQLVTSAEPITVTNAIQTATELNKFMEERGRSGQPCRVDLDAFLHCPTATSAPCRSLNSLRWLCRHGQLEWDVTSLVAPTHRSRKPTKGQALVVLPPMFPYLEERVEQLWKVQDERWTCLLASWIVSAGCLRYKHVQRSTIRKLSRSTIHCKCAKGKQARQRSGFAYCLPAVFNSGFPWAQTVLKQWEDLPEGRQSTSGLCFNSLGQAWTLHEVTETARSIFAEAVSAPEDLKSYSWRRMPTTAAHTMGMSPLELAALGDWVNKQDVPQESKMPMHYSGARYGQSLRAKHCVLRAMEELSRYESWELIPQEAIVKARAQGKAAADKAAQQDNTILWAVPLDPQEVRERFELTTALKSRAQKRKAEAMEPSTEGVMPDEIQGRITTAFLKNGEALCSSFQMNSCAAGSHCSKLHKCAVVLRTGRACGGSHPACECRDKRAVMAEPEEKPSRSVPARPKNPSKPAAKPRPKPKAPQEAPPLPASPPIAVPASAVEGAPILGQSGLASGPPQEEDEKHFDGLAGKGKKAAEPPTLIFSNNQGGQLWLAGLPRQHTLDQFPSTTTLQVVCFSQEVEAKGGVCLPGALLLRICPSSKRDREGQWKISWPTIRNTLQAGEVAVLHCVAGRHRAAGLGALLRAILMEESVDESASWIQQRRNIDMASLFRDHSIKEWIHNTKRSYAMVPPMPSTDGFMATAKSNAHLKTVGGIPLCAHKQAAEKASQRLVGPIFASNIASAKAWNKPLCQACYYRSPASMQMKLLNW